MPRNYKEKLPEKSTRSHYEDQWSTTDYKSHEEEFKKMLVEYHEIRKLAGDSATLARWMWLEKQGATAPLQITGGVLIDPRIRPSSYPMYAAKFDRFTEWLAFKERVNP